MRVSRRRRRPPAFVVFVPLAVLAGVLSWAWARRDHPPVRDLYDARIYLNLVRQTAREDEAQPILESAVQNVADAQRVLDGEFKKLEIFRDYDLARYHIGRARALGVEAVETARLARQAAVEECGHRLVDLRRSLKITRDLVHRLNVRGQALTRLTSADAFLTSAEGRLTAFETRDARQLLDRAEAELEDASITLQARLTRFLERRQEWNSWIRETLAESGQSSEPFLLVDKLNRECYVLRRGRVSESFSVEFGNGWMERKIMEGDRATPEGRYQVSKLKGIGNSRYHKAALLDYPNTTDRSRFVRAKRAGQIPRSARIGGLIEIHGEGGRGSNWTSGCISLTNGDMDRLMAMLQVGTRVTIVGVWQEPSWMGGGDLHNGALSRTGGAD